MFIYESQHSKTVVTLIISLNVYFENNTKEKQRSWNLVRTKSEVNNWNPFGKQICMVFTNSENAVAWHYNESLRGHSNMKYEDLSYILFLQVVVRTHTLCFSTWCLIY